MFKERDFYFFIFFIILIFHLFQFEFYTFFLQKIVHSELLIQSEMS